MLREADWQKKASVCGGHAGRGGDVAGLVVRCVVKNWGNKKQMVGKIVKGLSEGTSSRDISGDYNGMENAVAMKTHKKLK